MLSHLIQFRNYTASKVCFLTMLIGLEAGLQMGQFRVGTILHSNPDPFLNNSSGFRSDFDSKPVLLAPDLDPVPELGLSRGLKSSSKIEYNFFSFSFFLEISISFNL